MVIILGGDMPTHSNKHSDAPQIVEKILKEAGEKKSPAPVASKTREGNKGVKTEAA
jgi:hypothetical protein